MSNVEKVIYQIDNTTKNTKSKFIFNEDGSLEIELSNGSQKFSALISSDQKKSLYKFMGLEFEKC